MGVLGQGLVGWCGIMFVCGVRLDFLCRWQVQVSVYCARGGRVRNNLYVV